MPQERGTAAGQPDRHFVALPEVLRQARLHYKCDTLEVRQRMSSPRKLCFLGLSCTGTAPVVSPLAVNDGERTALMHA